MIQVIANEMRKGGSRKPNRGGGRFNKPRTQPPGKASERKEDTKGRQLDEDDFVQPRAERETDVSGPESNQSEQRSNSSSKPRYWTRPLKYQAPVQRLQMNQDNQDMVMKILQNLRVEGLREESEDSYEDFLSGISHYSHEVFKNENYWKRMEDQRLVVEEAVGFKKDEEIANKFSLSKLLKCGFEQGRCLTTLQNCDDDLGAALERLIMGSCGVTKFGREKQDSTQEQLDEAKVQRTEEALALESIYGDNFNETISDRIWVITLTLDYITEYFKQEKKRNDQCKPKVTEIRSKKMPRNLCKFFLKGHCRFGDKCRMSHQLRDTSSDSSVQANTDDNDDPNASTFHLEIRFPEGSVYPYEVPVIAFYSVLDIIPAHVSLNISLRLTEEARGLAEDGVPAVFTLASLLEDRDQVLQLLGSPPSEFSLPEIKKSSAVRQQEETEGHQIESKNNLRDSCKRNGSGVVALEREEQEKLNRKLKEQFRKLQVLCININWNTNTVY